MSEEDPEVTDEILDGVYRALCDHGYAALTMQDIADECEKSKSLLHYHYDTKEDLMVGFLERMLGNFEEKIDASDLPPADRLVEFIARFVFTPDDTERVSFHLALLEMRPQGPFNERIRESLQRSDDLLRAALIDILEDGIEEKAFEPVDVEETAALFVAMLDGARTRQITLNDRALDGEAYTQTVAQQAIEQLVDPLLKSGVERPTLDEAVESVHD
ncbi:TetR/AcrR family transcriptional regulator [Halovenus rubra]|uniref:TetR/AcrR family transcriptional regulator n=2 Tax=Halovenus rubra TaxID=869890 RepID=A0ABD5X6L3_9EURY|nr:TetR/AcrR family transcriptional regulator [Halovenus rubra]